MTKDAGSVKQKGKCPFCGEVVAAIVIDGNLVRRDRCKCPECEEYIFLCRSPGCHDYAKGTQVYDHELCSTCTDTIADGLKVVGKAALTIATTVVSGLLMAAVKKK